MNFIFSEQTLSVHYFGRAAVDDDHENNYRKLALRAPDPANGWKVSRRLCRESDARTLRKDDILCSIFWGQLFRLREEGGFGEEQNS